MKKIFRQILIFISFVVLAGSQGCQPATPVATVIPSAVATTAMQSDPTGQPSPTATSQPTPTPSGEKLDFRQFSKVILSVNPAARGDLYAYVQDSSVYHSQDGGSNWETLNEAEIKLMPPLVLNALLQVESVPFLRKILSPGINAVLLAVDSHSPQAFFAIDETANSVIASNDSGNSWVPVGQLAIPTFGGVLAIDPLKSGRLYLVSMGGIFRSEDGGKTWIDSSAGVRELGPSGYMFTQMIFHPMLATTIYLTGPGDYTYFSHDSGGSWSEIRLPETNNFFQGIRELYLDPRTNQTLYAINNFPPPDSRLYKSINGGQDWVEMNFNLPDGSFRSLLIDPSNPNHWYALLDEGEKSGLFMSEDSGETWREIEANVLP